MKWSDGTNIWIDGTKLNFIVGEDWFSIEGKNHGYIAGVPGDIKIESNPSASLFQLTYIDQYNNLRKINMTKSGEKTPLSGLEGLMCWIQGTISDI